jgi:hypothetical protein
MWLLRTETPIVLCALISPWLAGTPGLRRQRLWLLGFVATVFACYIPYQVFDAWWYLRFLLPAYPVLLALTAAVIATVLPRVSMPRRALGIAVVGLWMIFMVKESIALGVFGLWSFERRFRVAGEYVASHLPRNAAVVTGQESGSVRFYSGRLTLSWRELPAGALDRALDFLRAQGYRPFLLLETWEQPDFVSKFEGQTPIGGLGWPPIADIIHEARIYDPDDYARYRAGIPVRTDRVWIRRGQISIFHPDSTDSPK